VRDRVVDELVELLGLDHAAGQERRDALTTSATSR
jgi:hypothetical protein